MLRTLALAALLLCTGAASAQETQPTAEIGEIRAHLYYTFSGTLSENVLDPTRVYEFAGWNTIIGEGDAFEPADDLVVDVVITTSGEQFIDDPLRVWVTNEAGEEVASRTFHTLLTSGEGIVHSPLWVSGIGCAGTLSLNAEFRGQREAAEIRLSCGE